MKSMTHKTTKRHCVEYLHEEGQQPGSYYRDIHSRQLYFRMETTQGGKEINRWHTATRDGEPDCPIRKGIKFYTTDCNRRIYTIHEVLELGEKVTRTLPKKRSLTKKITAPELLCELAKLLPLVSTASIDKFAQIVSDERSKRRLNNNIDKQHKKTTL